MDNRVEPKDERHAVCQLDNLHCASCADRIEKVLKTVDGVNEARINYATRTLAIDYDRDKVSLDE
ncbi:MAG: cation transporter, partial [Candidatus Freyarchaeota archaeon]